MHDARRYVIYGQCATDAHFKEERWHQALARVLLKAGLVTTVRKTRGDDIDAACGQLAGDILDRTDVLRRVARQRTIELVRAPHI